MASRRSTPSLSATLIVRDEAAVLPRCLTSIRDLVDEIVVVDTGSTDDSPRIAADFGARVVASRWQNDFAVARNTALAHARGTWILYIDADESAQPLARDALMSHLSDPGLVASTVRFRPRTGLTRYREYRLFRNDPRIRFANVIHETMVPDLFAVMHADHLAIGKSELAIDHFGYDGNQDAKHRRNIPLLRERLARDPGHVYSWNHLGHALAGIGDTDGALAAWRRAVDVVRTRGVTSSLDRLPYGSLLLDPHAAAAHPGLLDEALERFGDDHLFHWLQGRRLLAGGRLEEAIALFEDLIAIEAEALCDDAGMAYDARIFGLFSHEALALCHFRLERYADSARYYALAHAADPLNPAHQIKQRLAEARGVRNR
ncbi:MAG TPA: glycosyltransferase [Candidatus Methylomirabilis sp.]|nr:glycosyltransferase [Candidatus Methylomirabilis sp.]